MESCLNCVQRIVEANTFTYKARRGAEKSKKTIACEARRMVKRRVTGQGGSVLECRVPGGFGEAYSARDFLI